MARRVIITGFMGSGKTSVGREVADRTGMDFIDTDVLAEAEMGMEIARAFREKGEDFFRLAEEAVIERLLAAGPVPPGQVISLGGGAVKSELVRRLLESEELVVLLEVDAGTAFSRAVGSGRPLAADEDEFRRLHEERQSLYEETAKVSIDTSGTGVEEVVDELMKILERQ